MFRSGFLIFIIPGSSLSQSSLSHTSSLQTIFKQIIINNKLSLYSNKSQSNKFFNINSLKFLMMKLGLIYKEPSMLEKSLNSLNYFDIKTSNFLYEYILKTADLDQIISNQNDNFFLYIIKITTKFIINQIDKRAEILKTEIKNPISSNQFQELYASSPAFKEMLILSKYLDTLRKLDNDIYFNKNICDKSLKQLISELNYFIQKKNFDKENINYLTNQLTVGRVANAENYIIHKIKFDNCSNLKLIKQMIVELYCYKILQENEKFYYVCITILKNVSYNPNLFFRNVCLKTNIKSLRNFLMNHLKHSKFISKEDELTFSYMKYIDDNYSNPSFEVEYRLKSTKILCEQEFRPIKIEKMSGKQKKIEMLQNEEINCQEYQTFTDDVNPKKNLINLFFIDDYSTESYKVFNVLNEETPLLADNNLTIIKELINFYDSKQNENFNIDDIERCFNEIYERFFLNKDVNDFGMNQNLFQKSLQFIENEYSSILEKLINRYFYDHDDTFYLSNQNRKDECILCKQQLISSATSSQNLHIKSTKHLGYSNISLENLKYWNKKNINRSKFDDFYQVNYSIDKFKKFLADNEFYNDMIKFESIYHYIKDHYKTSLLRIYMDGLVNHSFFQQNFINAGRKLYSKYFSKNNPYFTLLLNHIFPKSENTLFTEILFELFISNGILLISEIDESLIRKILRNNLFNDHEDIYSNYSSLTRGEFGKDELNNFVRQYEIRKTKPNGSKSKLDECMDNYILFTNSNYYFLQHFFDHNWFNAKIILSENYLSIDTWEKMIILSKLTSSFTDEEFIYEMAIENLNIYPYLDPSSENENTTMIIYSCLIYFKKNKITNHALYKKYNIGSYLDKLNTLIHEIFPEMPFVKPKDKNQNIKNTIFTLNGDISVKDLIGYYYPYLEKENLTQWNNREHNNKNNLDEFELMIENGKIIDAYYFYKNNLRSFYNIKQLAHWLNKICLNNLLNYNILASSVTFLRLINNTAKPNESKKGEGDTECGEEIINDLVAKVEKANNVLMKEIMNTEIDKEEKDIIIQFIKKKNCNKIEVTKSRMEIIEKLFMTIREDLSS